MQPAQNIDPLLENIFNALDIRDLQLLGQFKTYFGNLIREHRLDIYTEINQIIPKLTQVDNKIKAALDINPSIKKNIIGLNDLLSNFTRLQIFAILKKISNKTNPQDVINDLVNLINTKLNTVNNIISQKLVQTGGGNNLNETQIGGNLNDDLTEIATIISIALNINLVDIKLVIDNFSQEDKFKLFAEKPKIMELVKQLKTHDERLKLFGEEKLSGTSINSFNLLKQNLGILQITILLTAQNYEEFIKSLIDVFNEKIEIVNTLLKENITPPQPTSIQQQLPAPAPAPAPTNLLGGSNNNEYYLKKYKKYEAKYLNKKKYKM